MSALTRRISRPSAALIVAIVALFMALGGTSYAALKITGKNVANRSLTGVDVRNKSLGGNEMKKDTLDGDEINESALGTVPKAADADTVGGQPASSFMVKQPRGSRPRSRRTRTSPTTPWSAPWPTCRPAPTS